MPMLSWFDNRTLLACQFILAVVFAVVFLGMHRAYPDMRGLRSAALSFLVGIPGTFFLFSRGSIPMLLSVLGGNLLVLASFIFVYDAIVRFTGGRNLTKYLWLTMIVPTVFLWYYTQVNPNIVPRIVAIALISAFVRAFAAWELLSKARSFSSRITMRVFGIFLVFQILTGVNRALQTAFHGAPENYMIANAVQTFTLALNIIYICVCALCFLFIVIHELITHSRNESQQDALSGALNRRGIEAKLAIELKRINRSNQRLSIALIDVDNFKSINDSYGHATGDAALRRVAETISGRLRAYDNLGRFGGDEFLLILPQTIASDALLVTGRLSLAVSSLAIPGLSRPITLSMGLTEAIADDDATTLLARADKALYQAKSDGRNCRRLVSIEAAQEEDPTTTLADTLSLGNLLIPTSKPDLLQQ